MQKDGTDALEKMTSVLKVESARGERYDSLFEGAKSLVNGFGSILRVVSHEASVYDSHSESSKSHIKASFIDADGLLSRRSRKLAFRSRTSSYLWARRSKRDASDAQLQVENRQEIRLQNPYHK